MNSGVVVTDRGISMSTSEKNLSVLFADVSGNAWLQEKLGNAAALRAVDCCLKLMESAVEASGGRTVTAMGEELMAVFVVPDDAFRAAMAIQRGVSDLPSVSGVRMAARIGFAFGRVTECEGSYGGETVRAAARLTGLAKPGQILTSHQAWVVLSPTMQSFTRNTGSEVARGGGAGTPIFEFFAPEPAILREGKLRANEPVEVVPQCFRLSLRYAGRVFVLDDEKTSISMGRNEDSDVFIHDRRASRKHAWIERRGDTVVFTDKSTNGSFLTLADKVEFKLRRQECVIHGRGLISFAASATSPEADYAEFEQLLP